MPKASGQNMKTIRTAPRPQPARGIKHGRVPSGPKTTPSAMGAAKIAADLKPSPKKKGQPATARLIRARCGIEAADMTAPWQTQMPRYRLTRDLWPPVKAQLRNALPIPRTADLDDTWQYARTPVAAGDVITSKDWPHPSLQALNESARHVHAYFVAHNGKSWLPLRPWQDGRIVLDDKISTDSEGTAHG